MLSSYQVTKLCDLGHNDGVCSVQWTKEGSYISVGTALGQVQVVKMICFFLIAIVFKLEIDPALKFV